MKILSYYGGQGYGYSPEIGRFEIRHGEDAVEFTSLRDAIFVYEALSGEKALWDLTTIPELLDAYHFVEQDQENTHKNDLDFDDLPF